MATFVIATGTDDARETATVVSTNQTSIDNELDATTDWAGLRFQNVTVAQGATIASAKLTFTVISSSADEPDVVIFGEAADNAATFNAATASGISGRTPTSASVAWSSADLGAGTNTTHDSPDLSAIVQEIVNRAGWASGNAMAFLIQGSANSARDLAFRMYEYTGTGGTDPQGTYSAVLTITLASGATNQRLTLLGVG